MAAINIKTHRRENIRVHHMYQGYYYIKLYFQLYIFSHTFIIQSKFIEHIYGSRPESYHWWNLGPYNFLWSVCLGRRNLSCALQDAQKHPCLLPSSTPTQAMTTKNVFMYFQTSFGVQWGGLAKLSLVEVHYLRRINEDKIPNLISAIPKCMFFSLLHFLKALGIASFLNGNQYPFWSLGWYQSQFLTATLDSVSTLLKFYGLSGDSFTCV